MPGGGDFILFFRPGGRSFALKNCPGAGILREKISGPAVSPGGMVTGQIDTSIRRKSITRVCLYSSCVAVAAQGNFIAKLSILTSAR